MRERKREDFYLAAQMHMGLSAEEVDAILAAAGVSLEVDGIEVCIDVMARSAPERHEAGRRAAQRLPDDLPELHRDDSESPSE